ncbi:MAG TPA: hypothetical protein VM345_11990 [Acidimicrobiales bacterium]|jgi:hypothetical protein|nr:hypothetical protein [Acidimicrobiales bacterium]
MTTFDQLFDIDRPPIRAAREYVVTVRAGGGWEAFAGALTRLLTRCSEEGLWWATIDLASERTPAFAHLGPDDNNMVWTEVSSEFYLPGFTITDKQVDALHRLGWDDPLDEPGMENYHRSWNAADLEQAVVHVVATLVDVYGFDDNDEVRVLVEPFDVEPAPL